MFRIAWLILMASSVAHNASYATPPATEYTRYKISNHNGGQLPPRLHYLGYPETARLVGSHNLNRYAQFARDITKPIDMTVLNRDYQVYARHVDESITVAMPTHSVASFVQWAHSDKSSTILLEETGKLLTPPILRAWRTRIPYSNKEIKKLKKKLQPASESLELSFHPNVDDSTILILAYGDDQTHGIHNEFFETEGYEPQNLVSESTSSFITNDASLLANELQVNNQRDIDQAQNLAIHYRPDHHFDSLLNIFKQVAGIEDLAGFEYFRTYGDETILEPKKGQHIDPSVFAGLCRLSGVRVARAPAASEIASSNYVLIPRRENISISDEQRPQYAAAAVALADLAGGAVFLSSLGTTLVEQALDGPYANGQTDDVANDRLIEWLEQHISARDFPFTSPIIRTHTPLEPDQLSVFFDAVKLAGFDIFMAPGTYTINEEEQDGRSVAMLTSPTNFAWDPLLTKLAQHERPDRQHFWKEIVMALFTARQHFQTQRKKIMSTIANIDFHATPFSVGDGGITLPLFRDLDQLVGGQRPTRINYITIDPTTLIPVPRPKQPKIPSTSTSPTPEHLTKIQPQERIPSDEFLPPEINNFFGHNAHIRNMELRDQSPEKLLERLSAYISHLKSNNENKPGLIGSVGSWVFEKKSANEPDVEITVENLDPIISDKAQPIERRSAASLLKRLISNYTLAMKLEAELVKHKTLLNALEEDEELIRMMTSNDTISQADYGEIDAKVSALYRALEDIDDSSQAGDAPNNGEQKIERLSNTFVQDNLKMYTDSLLNAAQELVASKTD